MLPFSLGDSRNGPLTILCLGAHSDDIEIGCGATLLRLLAERPGSSVLWAVLSADSFLDMTHKFMLYKYLDSIWPEAPNGPVEGNVWSELVYDYSATYSPNPDRPPFYVDLPVAHPSGELIQEVWDRWLAFDPVVNVHDRLDNLRKLTGILLDAGSNDDYNLHWGHRLLSHYLNEAGIAHEHRENPGNHGGRAYERYQMALQWLSQVLERD